MLVSPLLFLAVHLWTHVDAGPPLRLTEHFSFRLTAGEASDIRFLATLRGADESVIIRKWVAQGLRRELARRLKQVTKVKP